MDSSLQASPIETQDPSAPHYFLTMKGEAGKTGEMQTEVQIPNTGRVWYKYTAYKSNLDASYNGHTYGNIPQGQYTKTDLSTPLALRITVQNDGEGKLEWKIL